MLHLHGPFAADDFLKTRDRAGHAHLVVPAAIAPDLESAAILEGLASTVLLSRLSAEAGFTPPPSFASPCPLVDLYAIDETAAVAEPRRGASAAQPAPEPHFVGLDDARVLAIERVADDHALAFRGAAVTPERPIGEA